MADWQECIEIVKSETGIVIPVYLPDTVDVELGAALLRDNVIAYCQQVNDPMAICLSVDGEQSGAQVAGQIARELGTSLAISAANRGKLSAAANGVRALLGRATLLDKAALSGKAIFRYIAVVDQDGDHFANELLNFVRTARHIARQTGSERVLVLGQRSSRHRPMGFLRGELEELADRVLLDALAYHAAMTGRPLRLEYAASLAEFPDWHSGYKLFDRATAAQVFLEPPQLAGVSDDCYYRHAVEAVVVVEALECGAYLGVVNRSTMNEQPISTFGQFRVSQLTADMIVWPCRRLEAPAAFVEQWMANHISRLLLNTLSPAGKEELERVRQLVGQGMSSTASGGKQPGGSKAVSPLFV